MFLTFRKLVKDPNKIVPASPKNNNCHENQIKIRFATKWTLIIYDIFMLFMTFLFFFSDSKNLFKKLTSL